MHLWILDEVPCPPIIGFMKMIYIKGRIIAEFQFLVLIWSNLWYQTQVIY